MKIWRLFVGAQPTNDGGLVLASWAYVTGYWRWALYRHPWRAWRFSFGGGYGERLRFSPLGGFRHPLSINLAIPLLGQFRLSTQAPMPAMKTWGAPPAPPPKPARPQRNDVVPGKFYCAKCKFSLQRMVMHAGTGAVGVSADNTPEKCPNDGAPMWPVTWEKEARDSTELLEQVWERMTKAEKELREMREAGALDISIARSKLAVAEARLARIKGKPADDAAVERGLDDVLDRSVFMLRRAAEVDLTAADIEPGQIMALCDHHPFCCCSVPADGDEGPFQRFTVAFLDGQTREVGALNFSVAKALAAYCRAMEGAVTHHELCVDESASGQANLERFLQQNAAGAPPATGP